MEGAGEWEEVEESSSMETAFLIRETHPCAGDQHNNFQHLASSSLTLNPAQGETPCPDGMGRAWSATSSRQKVLGMKHR